MNREKVIKNGTVGLELKDFLNKLACTSEANSKFDVECSMEFAISEMHEDSVPPISLWFSERKTAKRQKIMHVERA